MDDHGEGYPDTAEGPSLYCSFRIPAGLFVLSSYNVNDDGHSANGKNMRRDYRVALRTHEKGQPLNDILHFLDEPELATNRSNEFYCGVWKSFLVRGPAELTLEVNRNYSFNTTLNATMLDLVEENAPPYGSTKEQWKKQWDAELLAAKSGIAPVSPDQTPAEKCFGQLEGLLVRNPKEWAKNSPELYMLLLRTWVTQAGTSDALKGIVGKAGTCAMRLNCYPLWEAMTQKLGVSTPRQIENAMRWDGVTKNYIGLEYAKIREVVAKMSLQK